MIKIKENNAMKINISTFHSILTIGIILTIILIYIFYQVLLPNLQNLENTTNQLNIQNRMLEISRNNYINFTENMQTLEQLQQYQTIVKTENIANILAEISHALSIYNLSQSRFELSNQQYSEDLTITVLTLTGTGDYANILNYLNFLRNTEFLVVLYNVSMQNLEHGIYFNLILFIPNIL